MDRKIGYFGSDASSLEVPRTDYQTKPQAIMNTGIPMIESLRGLAQVVKAERIAFVLLLSIEGLEASSLRVIAKPMEELPGAYKIRLAEDLPHDAGASRS